MSGKGHWHFKTGRYVDGDGYVRILTPDGYQPEHRVKMERKLGRRLRATEVVRHKDGDKANNRLSNLQVVTVRSATPRRRRTRQVA